MTSHTLLFSPPCKAYILYFFFVRVMQSWKRLFFSQMLQMLIFTFFSSCYNEVGATLTLFSLLRLYIIFVLFCKMYAIFFEDVYKFLYLQLKSVNIF